MGWMDNAVFVVLRGCQTEVCRYPKDPSMANLVGGECGIVSREAPAKIAFIELLKGVHVSPMLFVLMLVERWIQYTPLLRPLCH